MEQTFQDLSREHAAAGGGVFAFALWMYADTFQSIVSELFSHFFMHTLTKRLFIWAVVVALILCIPLVAMQFTPEVQWDTFDFVFMGVLLFGAASTYELVSSRGSTLAYRGGVAFAGIATVLLVWINGAVGIIGSEDNPANLLYAGVILTATTGVCIARLRPMGMFRAMIATAIAQFLVPIIALIIWRPDFAPGVIGVLFLNGIFVGMWVASALLFREAARKQHPAVVG
jgi:hypothetical protein